MYSLMKKIITEKDIKRQVSLVELLLNHSQITVNELAEVVNPQSVRFFLIFKQSKPNYLKAG